MYICRTAVGWNCLSKEDLYIGGEKDEIFHWSPAPSSSSPIKEKKKGKVCPKK